MHISLRLKVVSTCQQYKSTLCTALPTKCLSNPFFARCRTNLSLRDSGSGPLRFLNDLWGRFSYQYYSALFRLLCRNLSSCTACAVSR
jgi:hypothetical protein